MLKYLAAAHLMFNYQKFGLLFSKTYFVASLNIWVGYCSYRLKHRAWGELQYLRESSASVFLNTNHKHYQQKGSLEELIINIKSHREFLLFYMIRSSAIRKPTWITTQLNSVYRGRPEAKSNCY